MVVRACGSQGRCTVVGHMGGFSMTECVGRRGGHESDPTTSVGPVLSTETETLCFCLTQCREQRRSSERPTTRPGHALPWEDSPTVIGRHTCTYSFARVNSFFYEGWAWPFSWRTWHTFLTVSESITECLGT